MCSYHKQSRFSGLPIFKIDKVDFGFELNYANG